MASWEASDLFGLPEDLAVVAKNYRPDFDHKQQRGQLIVVVRHRGGTQVGGRRFYSSTDLWMLKGGIDDAMGAFAEAWNLSKEMALRDKIMALGKGDNGAAPSISPSPSRGKKRAAPARKPVTPFTYDPSEHMMHRQGVARFRVRRGGRRGRRSDARHVHRAGRPEMQAPAQDHGQMLEAQLRAVALDAYGRGQRSRTDAEDGS